MFSHTTHEAPRSPWRPSINRYIQHQREKSVSQVFLLYWCLFMLIQKQIKILVIYFSVGDCLRKQCRSILEKDCPKKGNLDLFGNLGEKRQSQSRSQFSIFCLQLAKFQAVLMFHTRCFCILRHICCCMLKMHQ